MLTVRELMNPKIRDKESTLTLTADTRFLDIDLNQILHVQNEFVNVVENGEIAGAVKTEKLCYLVRKGHEIDFKQVLDSLDVGIVIIDRDSRIFYVNPAYTRILHVEAAKVLGRYMNLIEPDAALLQVVKTGEHMARDNQLIKSVNTYVSTMMHPLFEDGEIVGAYSIFTDVTQINMLHREVKRISGVAEEYNRQIEENALLERNHVVGKSKVYMDCVSKAIKVSGTDAMVLLRGENGVGKEIITRIIQQNSLRADKPFITVNCSAIPETLIESELFGYEEGSFSGASKGGKMGKFQLADGGTLFLDEIGDMPFYMQAKLLRVLQEGEIEKVGRQENIPVDVRVIAATNKPLEWMVEEGQFRQDLYYRLNVVSINIPPLSQRGNDVLLLADSFLGEYNDKYNKHVRIDKQVYQKFMEYSWPGNVRELKNTIESAVVLCDGERIQLSDLPESMAEQSKTTAPYCVSAEEFDDVPVGTLKEEVEAFERELILRVLAKNQGNREKTMEELQISKRTFYRKIAKSGTNET